MPQWFLTLEMHFLCTVIIAQLVCIINTIHVMIILINELRNTGRKGLVYLMGYPILYRTISYHGTVSWGGYTRPLRKIWNGKFLVYVGVSHDVDYFPYQVTGKISKSSF